MRRYERNYSCINREDQVKLKATKVCVLGCGGLGGYIIEMLARIGIGSITVVDGDTFNESNLNRQLLANEGNIGQLKVECAKERMKEVNGEVDVITFAEFINKENGNTIIEGHDIVVDALDNIEVRKEMYSICSKLGVPYIYGAIAGWYGQIATICPGDKTMDVLYKSSVSKGKEIELGNPSFTPAFVASLQVSEVIKIITGKGEIIRNSFLYVDLLTNEFEVFHL